MLTVGRTPVMNVFWFISAIGLTTPVLSGLGSDLGQAVSVRVRMSLTAICAVNEGDMDLEIAFYFYTRWKDYRLEYPKDINDLAIQLTHEHFRQLWIPHIHLRNAKTLYQVPHMGNELSLRLLPSKDIFTSNRYISKLICNFDFHLYPFDSQECAVEIESYSHSNKYLTMDLYENGAQMYVNMGSLPQFKVTSVIAKNCTEVWRIESFVDTYACIKVLIHMKRRSSFYIWQVYILSILLVTIAWLSMWVDVSSVPGRVGLGITTLLTLTTQFMYAQKSLPPISYFNALDMWMFACMVTVFLCLVEFVVSHVWSQRSVQEVEDVCKEGKEDQLERTSGE